MATSHSLELICCSQLPEEREVLRNQRVLILAPKDEQLALFQEIQPYAREVIIHDPETELKEASWQCAFRNWEWWGEADAYKAALSAFVQEIELTLSDVADFGAQTLKNVFNNVGVLERARSLKGLQGSLKGTPAFICGAGPSLSEHAELLRQARGLIF